MKKTLTAALTVGVMVLAAACGGGTSDDGGSPKAGGKLTVAIDAKPLCYAASLCYASFGSAVVVAAALESLAAPSNNEAGYEPQLAESITPSTDLKTFTVKLKSGVKWSDGTPFVAADVKELFETYFLAKTSILVASFATVKSIEAPDEHTVVFNLSAADSTFPLSLAAAYIWKPVPKADLKTIPIGTGAFVIKDWKPSGDTTLVRNPNYAGTKDGKKLPYFDEVDVKVITSGQTRLNALQSGQVDLALSVDAVTTAALGASGTAKYVTELNNGNGVLFNAAKPPFDDVRVRRALVAATDKEAVVEGIGGGSVRMQNWLPDSPWYSKKAEDLWPAFDVDQAKQELAEYVDSSDRSDGKSAGTPLELELKYESSNTAQAGAVALLQQQWKELGVKVKLTSVQQGVSFQDGASGNYDVMTWPLGLSNPVQLITLYYSSTPGLDVNHYANPKLQDLVAQMRKASDPAEFNSLAQDAEDVFATDAPFMYLNSLTVGWGAAKNLTKPGLDFYGNVNLSTLAGK